MRYVIGRVLEAMVVIISIVVLGFTAPLVISLLISIFNDTPMNECVMSVPFWLFSIMGIVASGVYMNQIYTDKAKISKEM